MSLDSIVTGFSRSGNELLKDGEEGAGKGEGGEEGVHVRSPVRIPVSNV